MARAKRVRPPSRPARWGAALTKAREALEALNEAREELEEIKSEYSDWLGNLPENLQQTALGEKLQAIDELDLDETSTSWVDEAEGLELPLGFGRD